MIYGLKSGIQRLILIRIHCYLFIYFGEMSIAFREGSVALKTGEMFVVPKGTEHRPFVKTECKALLIEPAGTINTGGTGGEMTAADNVWI